MHWFNWIVLSIIVWEMFWIIVYPHMLYPYVRVRTTTLSWLIAIPFLPLLLIVEWCSKVLKR